MWRTLLTLVANEGEAAYYKGEIAKAILKTSEELGGTMTAGDLAEYSAEWVDPISDSVSRLDGVRAAA